MIRKYRILIWICLILFSSCQSRSTNSNKAFGGSIVLQEEKTISAKNGPEPVNLICYQDKTNRLYAVLDGTLIAWDLDSGKMISEYPLGIVSTVGLDFSKDCSLLTGAIQKNIQDSIEYVDGIKVWDTSSGKEIDCLSTFCHGESHDPDELGAAINSNKEFFITYTDISLEIIDLDKSQTSGAQLRPIDDNYPTISRIIFAQNSNLHAVGYLEGAIEIYNIGPFGWGSLFPQRVLGQNHREDKQPVMALEFSPNDHWIARIRAGRVTVWQMDFLSNKVVLDESVGGQSLLQFFGPSHFIVTGGNGKIDIFNFDTQKMIKEYDASGIASLYAGSDGKELFWGDQMGNIHLMRIINN